MLFSVDVLVGLWLRVFVEGDGTFAFDGVLFEDIGSKQIVEVGAHMRDISIEKHQ